MRASVLSALFVAAPVFYAGGEVSALESALALEQGQASVLEQEQVSVSALALALALAPVLEQGEYAQDRALASVSVLEPEVECASDRVLVLESESE